VSATAPRRPEQGLQQGKLGIHHEHNGLSLSHSVLEQQVAEHLPGRDLLEWFVEGQVVNGQDAWSS
jgi:hypothetical protein